MKAFFGSGLRAAATMTVTPMTAITPRRVAAVATTSQGVSPVHPPRTSPGDGSVSPSAERASGATTRHEISLSVSSLALMP